MSMQLYITYGAVTINLQTDGYKVADGFYPITAASIDQSVSDRIDLWVKSSDLASKISALDKAFEYARTHADRPDNAWIYFSMAATGEAYRARLLNGLVMQDSKLQSRWAQNRGNLHVTIERSGYWEGPETAVTLSNPSGSGTTGVTVYNHFDAGHVNYVQIAADQIAGNLRTPLKLQITNNYNVVAKLAALWVGHNAQSDPANFNPILEAEAATGGTPGSDASCSNGQYNEYTLNSSGEILMFTWALSASLLDDCAAQYFKTLMRFRGAGNTDVWFRPYIYYGTAVPLWRGPLVRFDSSYARGVRDLAVMQLPPWLDTLSSLDGLSLRLYGKRVDAEDTTVSLDFLCLLPVESYRLFEVNGDVAYQSAIVDDGPSRQVYSQSSSGGSRRADVVAYGSPIMAHPGALQRLYFLAHSSTADTAEIARTLSIQAWYRPRRLSV